jgi:hypothetical protein
MLRLLVHVEGQTEEVFVNEVLRKHLSGFGYASVNARIIGNARLRHHRGGIRSWPSVRRDIVKHLRQDPGCIATTMVDFYGLPQTGEGAWPGRSEAAGIGTSNKASFVEEALLENLASEIGDDFDRSRFLPFVVMHEFEALLFSNCAAFAAGIGRADLATAFKQVRDSFETPEDINDKPETCPSRRIQILVPSYEKPLLGILAVLEIGLAQIRFQCPHFNNWIARLESRSR